MTAPLFFINGRPVPAEDRRPCPRTLDGWELGWRVAAHLAAKEAPCPR